MTTPRLIRIACMCCVTLVLAACGGPTEPSGGSGTTAGPTPTSFSISAPPIGPGETVQFSATARLSDGSTANYTDRVSWRSENQPVLTITSTGQATGMTSGESDVSVSFAGKLGALTVVMVTPAGTHRLTGQVRESGLPVSGATVAVVSGQGTGLSTLTNLAGGYRLYGVAGPIQIQVSKSGYDSIVRDLTVSTNEVLDISDIGQTGGTPSLAGTYTLTVSASADCSTLPAEARNRTYTASVVQTGALLQVTLSGADFVFDRNHFSVRLTPQGARFTLPDSDQTDPWFPAYMGVIEHINPTTRLTFIGTAEAATGPDGISAKFIGTIGVVIGESPDGGLRLLPNCNGVHQVTLTPIALPQAY